MGKKAMTKQELLENREEILLQYSKIQPRSRKLPVLTKKERKVLGIGKDEGRASRRNIRIAPRKVSIVCDQIRGKDLSEAKAILMYTNKGAAPILLKLLESAEANAVNNNSLDADELYISDIQVGPGPIMKRWRARGKGSASRINKRTSHVSIVVKERA